MLLSVIALNSIARPQVSYAAAKYEYAARMDNGPADPTELINKMAAVGFELVAAPSWPTGVMLIFRRPL
jgi:hypothetical protein